MDAIKSHIKWIIDPIEFLKMCKINDAHKGTVDFELWPHITDLVRTVEDNQYTIVVKSKQIGVSYFLALARALWKSLTREGWTHLFISSGEAQAIDLLKKTKFAYERLPKEIQSIAVPSKWSETEITFPSLGSSIQALPSTETGAVGKTASEVDIDEWDFHPYPEEDWATAESTTSGGGKIVGVSTRWRGLDSMFMRTYMGAKKNENNFKPIFLSCFSRPDRDEKWFEHEQKNYTMVDGRLFPWNFPRDEEEALSSAGMASFFKEDVIKNLIEQAREPLETKYGFMHIYSKYNHRVAYAAGADISQGVGGDYQALIILGKQGQTVEDVAYIHSNDLSFSTYAHYTNELCTDYNFPILGGEANSMGLSYLQTLAEMHYPRLFHRGDKIKVLGWWTDRERREMALIELEKALSDGTLIIRYKPLLHQLAQFQRVEGRDGGVKYQSMGKHDDLVMALAIAYQMIKKVKPRGVGTVPTLTRQVTLSGMYR